TSDVAHDLRIPVGDLQTESCRLGVDAVSAADDGRMLELAGPACQNGLELFQIIQDDLGSFFDLQSLGSIDYVVRSESVMEPSSLRTNLFAYSGGKGDHVMLYFAFDFVDSLDLKVAQFGNCFGSLLGNNAGFRQSQAGCDFHLKPAAKLIFIAPDSAHFRAGI